MGGIVFWDVDTQRDLMEVTGSFYVPGAQSILPGLRRLHGWLTSETPGRRVASACWHDPEDEEISAPKPDYKETFPPHCLRDTPGEGRIAETSCSHPLTLGPDRQAADEVAEQVREWSGEVLLLKKRFDVFSNPNTETVLKALDPDRVVIYGVALDLGVRQAVEGMLDRGIRDLWLVTDATRPVKIKERDTVLEALRDRGVRLVTSRELVQGAAKTAASGVAP